jgi:aminodeoxyfutalosine deaminase
MSTVRARWLMTGADSVLDNGWCVADAGRVVDVGYGTPPSGCRDLGDVVLLPGLVNAHTHLELSWLSGRVPPADSMDQWIGAMMGTRRHGLPDGVVGEDAATRRAIEHLRATGTVLVGDVTNTLRPVPLVTTAGMTAAVFHEILGFNPDDPRTMVDEAATRVANWPHATVVGHAPYSTSPELFRAIARAHRGPTPLAVHLAESQEEMEFLRTGQGPMRALLEALDVWTPGWTPPGRHPVRYLQDLGYVRQGTLIVHGVHLSPEDLDDVRAAGAVIVTCPRSNVWVGGGVPPVARFYAAGLDVAVGTDSLASNDTLNLFDELAALRRLAPEVDAGRLLDSATRVGAAVLGFGATHGRIAPGCVSQCVSVRVPSLLTRPADVEEYLVSGVPPEDVMPVDVSVA